MAFKNFKWEDGFFPNASDTSRDSPALASSSGPDDGSGRSTVSDASPHPPSFSPNHTVNPSLGVNSSQPTLSPIYVPSSFTPNLPSPNTLGTPDSGYQSDNVPVICGLCPSTLAAGNPSAAQLAQWRYNMEAHLATVHPEYASPRNPDAQQRLPHAVWTSMATTEAEERAMGIPESKIPLVWPARMKGLMNPASS
ncbi:hypothetical protein B0H10DRAFT_2029088 [Mycena sp. CBHHK59/15]|nr:hypothetical protein B0H10DRAFT_2029088 [Mycena sp. CBHHK59/15]